MPSANDPSTELQTAIRTRLRADATLMAAFLNNVPVFEFVPQTKEMPYLLVQELDSAPLDDDSTVRGKVHLIGINFYDAAKTTEKVKSWMRAAFLSLDRSAFAVTGHTLVNSVFLSQSSRIDERLRVAFGTQRWRFVTEEAL